jgi:hypothetical protein
MAMATEQILYPSDGEDASRSLKLHRPEADSRPSADGPKAPPWNTAFTVAAFCGLVGMMVSWALLPARYQATSQLQILASPAAQDAARPGENPEAVRRLQMRQIAGDSLLRTVLEMPDIAKLSLLTQQGDPLRWLQDNLQVAPVDGTDVVDVNLSGNKYRDLIKILGAVDDVFVGMARQADGQVVQRRREQMLEQFKPLIAEVKQRSDQLYRELSDAGLDQGRVMRVGDEEHMRWAVDMAGTIEVWPATSSGSAKTATCWPTSIVPARPCKPRWAPRAISRRNPMPRSRFRRSRWKPCGSEPPRASSRPPPRRGRISTPSCDRWTRSGPTSRKNSRPPRTSATRPAGPWTVWSPPRPG